MVSSGRFHIRNQHQQFQQINKTHDGGLFVRTAQHLSNNKENMRKRNILRCAVC